MVYDEDPFRVLGLVASLLALAINGAVVWLAQSADVEQVSRPSSSPAVDVDQTGMKVCPDCAERVQGSARVCRYCGYDFESGVSRPAGGATSSYAIASLILGLLWLGGLGSILALIFGYQARSQMRANPAMQGSGMATAGLVLGWLGVIVIVLWVLLLVAA